MGEMSRKDIGNWGEDVASSIVSQMGYRILKRNATFRRGELDIVALDDDELVIVEVRVRSRCDVQSPIESVGPRKIKSLIRAGRALVEQLEWEGPWRIDILGITLKPEDVGGYGWEYVKNITLGMM
ncbi:putative endonuclease related to Holliday junction resolvase [Acetomicrobium mobile DSM 13181]|uniref:UPF0102 protein Anamo_0249 n=3 Tax=Acetomicrobium TaxID=49894 RepID=I4BUF2_ACEMN|nr:putative endonuclease related to Holliday junction resolvase [Acetomicrobium mobile DSM 13181]SIN66114.1 putative endonuclease [Acetomicrobium flavidum]